MIYSIGEALIDFMQEANGYIPHPGGAPANVAIHASRLGAHAAFVGKLSNDTMGAFLMEHLQKNNIYYPLPLSTKPTALALVSHVDGDRAFQFYRQDSADLFLSLEEIDTIPFSCHDILHFCSLGLVPEGSIYDAHLAAIRRCASNGGIISFDVNLRASLWSNLAIAKGRILALFPQCDIIKVNEEEAEWLTGTANPEKALRILQTHQQLIICTLGERGSVTLTSAGKFIKTDSVPTQQIDTTGAGDSFIGTVLAKLSSSPNDFKTWQIEELDQALKHASNISSRVVHNFGATPDINYSL